MLSPLPSQLSLFCALFVPLTEFTPLVGAEGFTVWTPHWVSPRCHLELCNYSSDLSRDLWFSSTRGWEGHQGD